MITIKRYTDSDRQLWNEFLRTSKNGYFLFYREYMEYHRDRFSDFSLLFFEDDRLVAIMPANLKDGVLHSHQGLTYGGVISDAHMSQNRMLSLFESLISFGREQSWTTLVYKAIPFFLHKVPSHEDSYALFRLGAKLTRVDCSSTIDLRAPISMSSSKKSGARKALRESISLSRSEDFDTFFSMVHSRLTARYQTKPVHTAAEMEQLAGNFPDNIVLYTASRREEMLAGVLVYVDGHFVHSQYISSTEEGRNLRAVDALVSHLVFEQYSDRFYFDFGISTVEQGLVLNETLCRQKEEFGASTTVNNFYELNFL